MVSPTHLDIHDVSRSDFMEADLEPLGLAFYRGGRVAPFLSLLK